jgi:hypothetical protein
VEVEELPSPSDTLRHHSTTTVDHGEGQTKVPVSQPHNLHLPQSDQLQNLPQDPLQNDTRSPFYYNSEPW